MGFRTSSSATELVQTQASNATFIFDLNADMYTTVVHQMNVGDVFYAVGKENPTTGYTWNVAADAAGTCGPAGAVSYTSSYVRNPNTDGYMGSGGTKTIKFTVKKSAVSGTLCQIGLTEDQSWTLAKGWEATP